ncbi:MAG: hypothetical protein L3J75_13290 [Methylococcaceae bacterium]|nr:hypothetical protein [Methylococcaceae bacterium]
MNCRVLILSFFFILQACSTGSTKPPENLLSLTEAQMKIRSYQTRVFDLSDQQKTLRAVVSALMDLGFIVERVNAPLGLVTAAKFAGSGHSGFVEATVTIKPKGENQVEIRANAIFNTKPIEDPKVYQNFFSTLQKSLFSS